MTDEEFKGEKEQNGCDDEDLNYFMYLSEVDSQKALWTSYSQKPQNVLNGLKKCISSPFMELIKKKSKVMPSVEKNINVSLTIDTLDPV